MDKNSCPKCGNSKKYFFPLCYDCSLLEKQKIKCDVCGVEIKEGHTLCIDHWKEKEGEKKKLKQLEFVEKSKKEEFREKYEGKYNFDRIPFKSKSEVILYMFLVQNGLHPRYEEEMNFNNHCYHPDFIIDDGRGNVIILEHFGMSEENYINGMKKKIIEYQKLCEDNEGFYFLYTTEEDLNNLKDKLGKKLNKTPLEKPHWK